MNEQTRTKLQETAGPFLEPGEHVELGTFGQSVPAIWTYVFAGVGALSFLLLPRVMIGAHGVLFDIVAGVVGAVCGALVLSRATSRKNGLVILTERNLYVIRPRMNSVARHAIGSVAVDIAGSRSQATLTIGSETLYLMGVQSFEAAQAVLAANRPTALPPSPMPSLPASEDTSPLA